jgi:hypothetical protein
MKCAKALILAPCCLNTREIRLHEKAKALNIDPFMYWNLHLFSLIENSNKNIFSDDQVLSTMNTFIVASKQDM